MGASFKVDTKILDQIASRFDDASVKAQIYDLPRQKAVAAMIGQAIATNFDQNGPGWKETRRGGQILRKTGLLMKSATTPGATGNVYNVDRTMITWGTNLHYARIHQRGGVIVPKKAKALFIPLSKKGEAAGPEKDPAVRAKNKLKYGKDFILLKKVVIPARPFLKLSNFWKMEIQEWMYRRMKSIITKRLKGES